MTLSKGGEGLGILGEHIYKDKLKYDPAGVGDFVFCDVSKGNRRGWNYIRVYNDWLKQG